MDIQLEYFEKTKSEMLLNKNEGNYVTFTWYCSETAKMMWRMGEIDCQDKLWHPIGKGRERVDKKLSD